MTRETTIIAGLFALFVIAFGVMVYMAGGSTGAVATTKISDMTQLIKDTSHTLGSPAAKVKIVEFGDYQCPACGAAYPIVKQVMAGYATNTEVAMVFRNFPLPQHANARISAEAAEAAGAQGKYWEMHDQLYQHQTDWGELQDPMPRFKEYATAIGLDMTAFNKALADHTFAAVVESDAQDSAKLALNHTPTIFINTEEIANKDINPTSLKEKIDAALAK